MALPTLPRSEEEQRGQVRESSGQQRTSSPFPKGLRLGRPGPNRGQEHLRVPSRNPIIKEAIQRERERNKGKIFLPGPYKISEAPGIPTYESVLREWQSEMGPVPDYIPVGAERNQFELPAAWDYKTATLGPYNNPLPAGAKGWTKYGRPYYGGDDFSVWGDIKSAWKGVWSGLLDETVETPAYTAFNQDWYDSIDKIARETPAGIGIHVGAPVAASIIGEIAKAIREFGNKARNVAPGTTWGSILSAAGAITGNIIQTAAYAVDIPTQAFKRTYMAVNMKNAILAERSTLPSMPEYEDWKRFLRLPVFGVANPYVTIYQQLRASEAMKRWTPEEREELAVGKGLDKRLLQASRIAYSALVHDGLGADYIRRLNEGADPRLLALELEDPIAEMWGEILNDPLIVWGLMNKGKRTKSMLQVAEAKFTVEAKHGEDFMQLLGDAPRTLSQGMPDDIAEMNRLHQGMLDVARTGEAETATDRSLKALWASSKRSVYGRADADNLGILASHYAGKGDEVLDTIKYMAMSVSDDAAEASRGLWGLARTDLSRDFLFSPTMNRTKILMRELLYDSAGKLKTGIIDDIAKAAGDPEKLMELAEARLGKIYKQHFPNVQEQAEQGIEYQRLLKDNTDEAARYLETHPGASQAISPAHLRVAKVHSGMEKYFFGPAYKAQGFLYMILSPAYYARNRLSNAFHVFVDQGIKPGLKTLIYGPSDAVAQIKKYSGGMIPTGAQFAYGGPAGATVPGFFQKGFLAKSAAHEKYAAQVIQAHSLRMTMMKSFEEGKEIHKLLGGIRDISPGESQYFMGLLRENGGNIDDAMKTFFSNKGQVARHFGWMPPEVQKTLMDFKANDEALSIYRTSRTREELATRLDELSDGVDELGDMVAGEAAGLDTEGMTRIERTHYTESIDTVRRNLGEEAADAMTRRINTNRAARLRVTAAQMESERFAIRKQQSLLEHKIRTDPQYAEQMNILDQGEIFKRAEQEGSNWMRATRKSAGIDELGERWTQHFADSDDYRDATWAISNAVKGKGGPWADLPFEELWRRAGFTTEMPKGITGQEFADKLWPFYRETQELRNAGQRELNYLVRRGYVEVLNQAFEIPDDLMSWNRANVAMDEARRLQNAFFDDGLFYAEDVIGGDALRAEYGELNRRLLEEGVPEKELETIQKRINEINNELLPTTPVVEDVLRAGMTDEIARATPDERWEIFERVAKEADEEGLITVYNAKGVDEGGYWVSKGHGVIAREPSDVLSKSRVAFIEPEKWDEIRDLAETRVGGYQPEVGFVPVDDADIKWQQIGSMPGGVEEVAAQYTRYQGGIWKAIEEGEVFPPAREFRMDLGEGGQSWVKMTDDEIKAAGLSTEPAAWNMERFPVAAADDGMQASAARVAHESRGGFRKFIDETLKPMMDEHFDDIPLGEESILQRADFEKFATEAKQKVNQTRAVGVEVANAAREFTIHDYGKRMGIDLPLMYIYPYQFWYSRTYMKWIKRVAQNPFLLASYYRYRNTMEKIHAGLPDWYKHQLNTNEMFGWDSDNPLLFNLESTINPIHGLTGVDWNDRYKRVDGTASLLDDLGKYGPTTWTPYSLALATYYHITGQDEAAARWGGRLTTATRAFRDATSLLGVKGGAGLEIDPFIHLYSGGMGPYDEARVGNALSEMQEEGYDLAALTDAANNHEGELWDMAVAKATKARAAGNLFAFVAGAGFKPRSPTDVQIQRMWNDKNALVKMKDVLSSEEYSQQWEKLREAYPFIDLVSLARKGGIERDETFAWSVLRRIPPGMSRDLAELVGIDPDLPGLFYDNKGDLLSMSESDRMHFMAGIADMAAILEIPSSATSQEWSQASTAYSRMYDEARKKWGDDIWDRVDNYYGAKGESQEDQDRANAILDKDPAISEVLNWKSLYVAYNPILATYYNGIDKLESYYKGRMWDQIEEELGSDIWEKWDILYALPEDSDARDDYWDENEDEFKRYGDIKDEWLPIIQERIDEFSKYIRDALPAQPRDVTPGSLGQEQLLEALRQSQAEQVQQFSPQQLRQILGEPLYQLILMGEDLPSVAQTRLAEIARGLGVGVETILNQLELTQ